MIRKFVWLRAWKSEDDESDSPQLFFEESTQRRSSHPECNFGGIERGNSRIVVFSEHWNSGGYLKKSELQLVALAYLDGKFNTTEVDLRQ